MTLTFTSFSSSLNSLFQLSYCIWPPSLLPAILLNLIFLQIIFLLTYYIYLLIYSSFFVTLCQECKHYDDREFFFLFSSQILSTYYIPAFCSMPGSWPPQKFQSPSQYRPFHNPEGSSKRRNVNLETYLAWDGQENEHNSPKEIIFSLYSRSFTFLFPG